MKKLFFFAFLSLGILNLNAQSVKQETVKDPHADHDHAKMPETKTGCLKRQPVAIKLNL